ncbi:unnamed protein product [Effrenium voratum]|uniref:Uncharacterized protein n=1 Tax=Effrenium voratum TaxID=2562239 RepID=A0AA36HXZ3_9DINO|nr:unnamed protein product [Effrenium voratum]
MRTRAWILGLAAAACADQCVDRDQDAQNLMQLQHGTRLRSASVPAPEDLAVEVQVDFTLEDEHGNHLFDSHPSLLEKRGQLHLGDARSSALRLRFSAHGHDFDLQLRKRRAPMSRNATVTLGTLDGVQTYHLRNRHVFDSEHAVLTSVGKTLHGVLRHGKAFLDVELAKGQRLLTVRASREAAALVERPLELPELWTDCYEGDDQVHAMGMGVAVGSKLYSKFTSKDEVIDYVIQVFSSANLIYRPQLNFVLVCRKLHLQTTHENAPSWDQGSHCPFGIEKQLEAFDDWDAPGQDVPSEQQGIWALLDDCFVSGTIGLAYVGTMCMMEKNYWNQYPNRGVIWHSFRTWITFAHEIGHTFGGGHSFEMGMGTTGGIMDYGGGQLNGIFQFNTQFRKAEMCQVMDHAVRSQCSALWLFDGKCGNGILTDDEECECSNGSLNCAFCNNCTLEKDKSCTPDGYGVHPINLGMGIGDCCTSTGSFKVAGSVCHVPGVGDGYCTSGLCIPSKCSDYNFVGDYCGLQPQNDCKFMCTDNNHACSSMEGWLVNAQPANYVHDQVPCTFANPGDGICVSGQCFPAVEGCGNSLREEDEGCECKDGSQECKFCSNCKLDSGKQCSPEGIEQECCTDDGHFRPAGSICTRSDNAQGYCMAGLCQDTPCSSFKVWDGFGDFCGLHSDSSCKFKCTYQGQCSSLDGWVLSGKPMHDLPDGTPCDRDGSFGRCDDGLCHPETKESGAQRPLTCSQVAGVTQAPKMSIQPLMMLAPSQIMLTPKMRQQTTRQRSAIQTMLAPKVRRLSMTKKLAEVAHPATA